MHLVMGTIIGRWYVTAFGLAFLYYGWRWLGARKLIVYACLSVALAALAENASVYWGVPYTHYTFNDQLRSQELWLVDVPVMVPLSYSFVMFFAFAAARLVASGPWRTVPPSPFAAYALAVVFATWATWSLDPVSQRGAAWYLGDLFHYTHPGFWFGLPLLSQVGWFCVSAVLCGSLAYLTRDEVDRAVPSLREHPLFPCLITFGVVTLHVSVVALVIGETTLGGAGLIIWLPAAAVIAVLWPQLRPAAAAHAAAREQGGVMRRAS
jgi:uncharacterized membrane protein